MNRLVRGLTKNRAETHPDADDRRLRGRTYAIPFERVWRAALELADGGLSRWKVVEADDEEGTIHAESTTLVFRFVDDIHIEIGLDENAQTRLDVRASSRVGKADLGRNPRTIGRFLKRMDRALDARPEEILAAAPHPTRSR